MDTSQTKRPRLGRRDFLKLVAAGGTTAVVGHVLFTYAPWLNYDEQAEQTRSKSSPSEPEKPGPMQELVRYATLAANAHNSQPWKFAIAQDAIQIHPDYARRLAAVDPHDRELWISLGCALENLVIAAQRAGHECEVAFPAPGSDYIHVALRRQNPVVSDPLFEAIARRQNTRAPYDGRPLPPADLKRIESVPGEAGISAQVLTADQFGAVLEYIKAGDRQQYGEQAFIDELVSWLRFNKPEAFATLDGLYARCSGNPEVPRWLGQLFVSSASANQQAQTDEQNVRSSSGLLVIASEGDDRHAWINAGRVYERLALTLTTMNIKSAFMNQPIEVADLRSQFQSYLNLGAAHPQLLLRFGSADPMPRSLRRPLSQVVAPAMPTANLTSNLTLDG